MKPRPSDGIGSLIPLGDTEKTRIRNVHWAGEDKIVFHHALGAHTA